MSITTANRLRPVDAFPSLLRTRAGSSLAEYALLAGLVAVVTIGSLAVIGDRVFHIFDRSSQSVAGAIDPVGPWLRLPAGNAATMDLARICPRSDDLTPGILTAVAAEPAYQLEGLGGYGGYDHSGRDFARAINLATAHMAVADNPDLRAGLVDALVAHADAGAWTPAGSPDAARWAIAEALTTVLPAYNRLRPDMDPREVRRVDAWLRNLLEEAELNSNQNNQRAQHGANLALFGHITGKQVYADRAVAIAREQLSSLREDGSMPLETERGRLALAYSSRTLASLTMIAEVTGTPSLYSEGIDRAARFLLDAETDNALVDGYAAANMHTPADLPWEPNAQVSPLQGGAGGWARIYAGALGNELLERTSVDGRVNHDTVGGWLGCF